MKHEWVTRRQGGDPADTDSCERVTYCDHCGVEYQEEIADGECPPAEE